MNIFVLREYAKANDLWGKNNCVSCLLAVLLLSVMDTFPSNSRLYR